MAITNTVKPYQLHAAFNEVLYTCTSDRYDAATNAKTPSAVATAAGFCKYTVGAHTFIVDDVLVGSGFTTSSLSNVTQTVTAIDATTITTDVVFVADDTGGTLTRSNNNFKILCEVKSGGSTIATMEVSADGSDFDFDISIILNNEIDYNGGHDIQAIGSTGLYSPTVQNSALNYTLTFTEWFDNAIGIYTAYDTLNVTTISGVSIYAYNTALREIGFATDTFSDYILTSSASKFLTKGILKKKDGEDVQLSFITEQTLVVLRYTQYDYAGTPTIITGANVTINNNRGIIVVDDTLLPSSIERVDIQILSPSPAFAPFSEIKSIYRDTLKVKNAVRIEFKNRLGGMDSYSFTDAEELNKTETEEIKVSDIYQSIYIDSKNEISLIGKGETADVIKWLEELYSSRVIYYNNNSKRIRVSIKSATNVVQTRDLIRPKIVIKLSDSKLN